MYDIHAEEMRGDHGMAAHRRYLKNVLVREKVGFSVDTERVLNGMGGEADVSTKLEHSQSRGHNDHQQ